MSGLLHSFAPYLAYGLISVIGRTSRIRYFGLENLLSVNAANRGFIYTFWHQRQVVFTYTHRDLGASVLVSRSRDGGIISKTMELSRIAAIRGSSSRGGSAAAKEMIGLLKSGRSVGITPDGPKGPARTIKPGVLTLAQLSGCPILPLTNAVSRKLTLKKSWDKFQVPLPFSDIVIGYAKPIYVMPDDDPEEISAQLRASLDAITHQADRMIGS